MIQVHLKQLLNLLLCSCCTRVNLRSCSGIIITLVCCLMSTTTSSIAADRSSTFRVVYLASLLIAGLLTFCHALTPPSTDRVKVSLSARCTRWNPKTLVHSRTIVILYSTRDSDRCDRLGSDDYVISTALSPLVVACCAGGSGSGEAKWRLSPK